MWQLSHTLHLPQQKAILQGRDASWSATKGPVNTVFIKIIIKNMSESQEAAQTFCLFLIEFLSILVQKRKENINTCIYLGTKHYLSKRSQ